MIAVDTNILVYAHRSDSAWHAVAAEKLIELAESGSAWGVPWPCAHEFFAKVTHPKIFAMPSQPEQALDFLMELAKSPTVSFWSESDDHLERLRALIVDGRVIGPMVHDARIAALCLSQGVSELWTADRDFGRFPRLNVRNPLVQS